MDSATIRLLEAYKAKSGISSDYQLSQAFGVSRQKISDYRVGRHSLADEKAVAIAEFCGIDPATALLEIQAERAEKQHLDSVARTLRDAARRLGGMIVAVLCFVGAFHSDDSFARQDQIFDGRVAFGKVRQPLDDNIHYPTWHGRIAAWLRHFLCRYQYVNFRAVIASV